MKHKLVILTLLAFLSACGDDPLVDDLLEEADNVTTMFGLGAAAVESLPQVGLTFSGAAINNSWDIHATALQTAGNIQDFTTLSMFFKMECFMPGMDDFCPAGTDTSGGDSSPYKLTSFTLIGSIYHADMYSGGLKSTCDGTDAVISASSFIAAQTGGDPAKYILDYYDLLSCVSQDTSDFVGTGTSYHAYSVDPNETYQATLTTQYRIPYNGVADPGQNNILQVYVGLDTGNPNILAFNYAGIGSMPQRTVLLLNTVTHKFAVKTYITSTNYLVAVGVGGVDITTGLPNSGYYYTSFTNNGGTVDDGCVDNTTGNFGVDTTSCTALSIPLTWSTSDTIADYLEIPAADRTRIAAFLGKFTDQNPLTAADAPANSTTDPEMNLPISITP